jgi:DNA-directed RNA polymerase specialized sigma24 family protein
MKIRPDAPPVRASHLRELTDSNELHQLVRSLYVHALRLGASSEAAEDMVQESLTVPLGKVDWFDPERGTLPAALRAVITHRFIDACRARERRKRLHAHHLEGQEAVEPSPAKQMADRTAYLNRQRFLVQLDEGEKALFAMWIRQNQGDVKGPEGAEALSMTYAEYEAAKKRLRRRSMAILEELEIDATDLWGGER